MSKNEIWIQVLGYLFNKYDDNAMKSALNLVSPSSTEIINDTFYLSSSNAFVESMINQSYLPVINEAFVAITGQSFKIAFEGSNSAVEGTTSFQQNTMVQQQPQQQVQQQPFVPIAQSNESEETTHQPKWLDTWVSPEQTQNNNQTTLEQRNNPVQSTPNAQENIKQGYEALFSKCTFESFIVGPSNEFAHGAALAVAEQPGLSYNPLFIYGTPGLGKTHLLIAIANYIMQTQPNMSICYAPTNQFLKHYVEAVRTNKFTDFDRRYHNVDILLIDDIQYLEGKDESLKEIFNIFQEMSGQNKQIVITSDRAPKDINMDKRLKTRFEQGLLVDIQPPNYETRLAIIKNIYSFKQKNSNFFGVIPEEVLEYVAENSPSSIRGIEGAITTLILKMNIANANSITIDEAAKILNELSSHSKKQNITIADIQREVEDFYEISHEEIIGARRTKDIAHARHVAIYLSKTYTNESFENIGKKFGNRDHATIMYSVNKIENDMKTNRPLLGEVKSLQQRLSERG